MSSGIAGLSDVVEDEWVVIDGVRYEPRHKVIEECARVAEEHDSGAFSWTEDGREVVQSTVAEAIRALKDK